MIPLLPLLGPLLPLSYNMTNISNTTYTIYANETFTADSDSEWMMKQDYEQNRQKFIKMNQAIHGLLQDVLALKKLDVQMVNGFRTQLQELEEELQQMEDSHDEESRQAIRQLTADMEEWMDSMARDIKLEFEERTAEMAEVAEAAEAEAEAEVADMWNHIIPAGVAALAIITVLFSAVAITIYKSVSLTSSV